MTQVNDENGKVEQLDIGRGVYIQRDAYTDSGDFVGHDKYVQGDEVRGDKLTVGNIINSTGVAIGGSVIFNGVIEYKPTAPDRVLDTLPAMSVKLVGRDVLIQSIIDRVSYSTGGNVICLRGFGGVGKSSLAIAIGHLCKDLFPGGRYFLSLRHKDIKNLLFNFLRELGYPTNPNLYDADAESLCSMIRGVLAKVTGRVLLILDNAEELSEKNQSLLEQLYLIPPHITIITTRNKLQKIDFQNEFFIEPLTEEESLNLLSNKGLDVVSERSAAVAIVKLLAGLPLALEIASSNAPNKMSCSYLLRELTKDGLTAIVDKLQIADADSPERSVALSFALSFSKLSKEKKRILFALALCPPSGSTIEILTYMQGVRGRLFEALLQLMLTGHLNRYAYNQQTSLPLVADNHSVDRLLKYLWNIDKTISQQIVELANKSLLQLEGKRVSVHPLMHYYLNNTLKSERNSEQLMTALFHRHMLYCACKVCNMFGDLNQLSAERSGSLNEIEHERDNLEWAQTIAVDRVSNHIVTIVMSQYWLLRDPPEAVEWLEKSQDIAMKLASFYAKFPPLKKQYLAHASALERTMVIFCARRGAIPDAITRTKNAIQLALSTGHTNIVPSFYLYLGQLYLLENDVSSAEKSLIDASEFITSMKSEMTKVLKYLFPLVRACIFSARNEFQKAIEQFKIAIDALQDAPLPFPDSVTSESTLRSEYAFCLSRAGLWDEAFENFSVVLANARQLGWESLEAVILRCLGEHYYRIGNKELSIQTYQSAKDVISRSGNILEEGCIRAQLGGITNDTSELLRATELLESNPKSVFRDEAIAYAKHQLGRIFLENGQWQDAQSTLLSAYERYIILEQSEKAEEVQQLLVDIGKLTA